MKIRVGFRFSSELSCHSVSQSKRQVSRTNKKGTWEKRKKEKRFMIEE